MHRSPRKIGGIVNQMAPDTQTLRYAWLEHEEGTWHLLTDLFADPNTSTRSWPDSLRALEELRKEGWTVVSPYPDSARSACGYGLRKMGKVASLSSGRPLAFAGQDGSASRW